MTKKSIDEKYIKRCIELSHEAAALGRNPFGCVIVKGSKVIAEAKNAKIENVSDHAEMLAMKEARKKLKTSDLSGCTIYSNFEPCPMCSFMIREHKISRVVFSLKSSLMGGFSKWKILQDKEISKIKPAFTKAPEIKRGVCKKEAVKVFNDLGWTIHK